MSRTSPEVMARLLRRAAGAAPLWLDVSGRSMGRSIVSGSRVLVTAGGVPQRDEVWAFCDPFGRVVVHRCVGQDEGSAYLFRGDSARQPDEPVPASRLVGRVVASEPIGAARRLVARMRRWR